MTSPKDASLDALVIGKKGICWAGSKTFIKRKKKWERFDGQYWRVMTGKEVRLFKKEARNSTHECAVRRIL